MRVLPHCALQGDGEKPWSKGQSQRILSKFQSNRKLTKKQLQMRSSQRFVEQATVSLPLPLNTHAMQQAMQRTWQGMSACKGMSTAGMEKGNATVSPRSMGATVWALSLEQGRSPLSGSLCRMLDTGDEGLGQ